MTNCSTRYVAICCSIALVAGLWVGNTNCTRKKATKTSPTADATKQASTEGKILNFGNLGEPEYMDPTMMQSNFENNIAMALFEGLTTYDPKTAQPVPGVAERWELSPDGKTYTFYLRKSAKWSDGKPLTAHDFAYSWERLLNPKTASEYAMSLFAVVNAEAYNGGKVTDPTQLGFKAIDDFTFQVTLNNPTPYFLFWTAHASTDPVPKAVVEQFAANWTRPEHMISNGPYMLKTWVPQKEVLVVKNPHYWDATNVKGAGIRFHAVEDRQTALKMYEAGQLDVLWELPTAQAPSLLGRPDLLDGPIVATYFYWINVTKPPLNDVRLRRALALSIDRQTLCDQYLQKIEIPNATFVPHGLAGYMPPPGPEFNPTEAKRLLAEAGYTDPSTLSVTISYNTDERHKLIAEVIQRMWKEHLGINVTLFNSEWKSYQKDLVNMNYQIGRMGWIGDYADPNAFLELTTSASTQNKGKWANPKYDELIKAAWAEPNPAKRMEFFRQAEAIVLDELPLIPIYTYKKMALVKPNVHGYYHNMLDLHPGKWMYVE